LAFAGEFEAALAELEEAQAHAYGSHDLSFTTALLRIKSIALSGGPLVAAQTLLEWVDPMADKLELGPNDPRRGEIEEARGLLARAEDDCDRAIVHHELARAIFDAAGQPTSAAKSSLNVGACHQIAERFDSAKRAYTDALEVYAQANVPPSYRNRVDVEFNLGTLALQTDDLVGLQHFEEVIRHGSEANALEAFHLAMILASTETEGGSAAEWANRALARLVEVHEPPIELAVNIRFTAGVIFAERGEERGLELMIEAERAAAEHNLDLDVRSRMKQDWIRWSIRQGRCVEAQTKLAELEAMEVEDRAAELEIASWREKWQAEPCKPSD
jgi:tetratricopeptide (TPR) repeat protein